MEFLQLYYTSCEKGRYGGKGFRTYSMSEGISENERLEIERYGVYMPPHHLPTQPSEEEINNLFPISFTFFRLSSGRFGICQSQYLGKDYTGRYGNYFCHALILKEGFFSVYPIQFYQHDSFRRNLSEQELVGDEVPDYLPELTLKPDFNQAEIFKQIQDFLEKEQHAILSALVDAIIHVKTSNRRLVLADDVENLATKLPIWITALQMAFPLKQAHYLTFTTYTYNPEQTDFSINVSPREGSGFGFSEMQKEFAFYVFDFANAEYSQVQTNFNYTQLAKTALQFSEVNLLDFYKYADAFNYPDIDESIDLIYLLFDLSHLTQIHIENGQFGAAIELLKQYADLSLKHEFVVQFAECSELVATYLPHENVQFLLNFLLTESPNPVPSQAYQFFFDLLDKRALQADDFEWLIALQNNIKCSSPAFIEASLSETHFAKIKLDSLSAVQILLHLKLTIDLLLEQPNAGFSPAVNTFLNACLVKMFRLDEQSLCGYLAQIAKQPSIFLKLMVLQWSHIQTDPQREKYVLCFIKIANAQKNVNWLSDIRKQLISEQCEDFIYAEFEHRLPMHKKLQPAIFWEFYRDYFIAIEKLKQQYLLQAVRFYLKTLSLAEISSKQKLEEYKKLLAEYAVHEENVGLISIITDFETVLLNEDLSTIKKHIVTLVKYKQEKAITTSPDITSMLNLLSEIEADKNLEIIEAIEKLPNPKELGGLNQPQYLTYMKQVLPIFFQCSMQKTEHEKLVKKLLTEHQDKKTFMKFYTELFIECSKTEKDPYMVIEFLRYTSASTNKGFIENSLLEKLLLVQKQFVFNAVKKHFKSSRGKKPKNIIGLLEDIANERAKSGSLITKLISPFKFFSNKK